MAAGWCIYVSVHEAIISSDYGIFAYSAPNYYVNLSWLIVNMILTKQPR